MSLDPRALKTFLAIRVPLSGAAQALSDFADASGLGLGSALSGFSARAAAIAGHFVDVRELTQQPQEA